VTGPVHRRITEPLSTVSDLAIIPSSPTVCQSDCGVTTLTTGRETDVVAPGPRVVSMAG
jgi:hypothetical protein